MRKLKLFGIGALALVSLYLKFLVTRERFFDDPSFLNLEWINYACNAVILFSLFSMAEKRLRHLWSSLFTAGVATAFFMLQLLAENYFWSYVWLNSMFRWEEPIVGYWKFVFSGLYRYVQYGYPDFHWALLGFLIPCLLLVFYRWRSNRIKVKRRIKNALLRLPNILKGRTVYDIVLAHFADCLTKEEYLAIKERYLGILDAEKEDLFDSFLTSLDEQFLSEEEETADGAAGREE